MNVLEWKTIRNKWKNRKPGDFVIILLLGVLFLILAIPTNQREKQDKTENSREELKEKEERETGLNREEYIKSIQQQLTEILESMEGVGKVKVMITLQDEGQVIVDKNRKSTKESMEDETVLYDVDDNTQPYVTERQTPKIEGVLVVAQGGDNGKVNADISDAIMALFDVEVHKIKIVKMLE